MQTETLHGMVESVRIGDRIVDDDTSLVTRSAGKIQLIRDYGVKGDRHAGARFLDSREDALLAFGFLRGMEIANHRQVSIVSLEELSLIEQALGLPNPLPFGYLGENIVLSGIPKLSQLPPRTKIFFQRKDGTLRAAVVDVYDENKPCKGPGLAIQSIFTHATDIAQRFPKAARGRRGIVGTVYVSGFVEEGDSAVAVLPE